MDPQIQDIFRETYPKVRLLDDMVVFEYLNIQTVLCSSYISTKSA